MRTYAPASTEAVLERLLEEPSLANAVVHHEILPPREAVTAPFPARGRKRPPRCQVLGGRFVSGAIMRRPMDQTPQLRLAEGQRLLDSGDLEAAIAALSPLTAEGDPEVAGSAWQAIGAARYRLDDEPGALDAWQHAADAGGSTAWLGWKSVAEQHVRDGNLEEAVEAYRRGDVEIFLAFLDPEVDVFSTPELANPGALRGPTPTPLPHRLGRRPVHPPQG